MFVLLFVLGSCFNHFLSIFQMNYHSYQLLKVKNNEWKNVSKTSSLTSPLFLPQKSNKMKSIFFSND